MYILYSSCNNKIIIYLIVPHSENVFFTCSQLICNILYILSVPYTASFSISFSWFHSFFLFHGFISFLFSYFMVLFRSLSIPVSSFFWLSQENWKKLCNLLMSCLLFFSPAVNCCCCQTNSARTTLPVLPSGENLPVWTCHSLYSFIFDLNLICLFLPSMTNKEVLSLVLNFQYRTNVVIVMILIIMVMIMTITIIIIIIIIIMIIIINANNNDNNNND